MKGTCAADAFGAHFELPRRMVDRVSYIVRKCAGKRVLHVGCADFSSAAGWESAVVGGAWLHRLIEKAAKEAVGIDNAADAVETLRSWYGITTVCVGDAEHLEVLGMGTFDLVVGGEILEHLPCPGDFLRSAHAVLEDEGQLLVTTTNAYCARRFVHIPFGKESIHPDHCAYYSHRTLQRLAEICGSHIVEQCSYRIHNKKPLLPYVAERIASWISPNLCEGIICVLRKGACQSPLHV